MEKEKETHFGMKNGPQLLTRTLINKKSMKFSNFGRIRRFKKEIDDWVILKSQNVNGYKYFTFKSNIDWKHKKTKIVHKLVAEAFCKKPNDEHEFVIHLDFKKENNHADNLKWVTRDMLSEHHKENPNYKNINRKGRITNAKLTESDVIRLKKKLKRGKYKLYKLAKEFGITHTQLNRIRSGENWGHVTIPEEDNK
jgi:DNA-binding Xre family transcriptional regulator